MRPIILIVTLLLAQMISHAATIKGRITDTQGNGLAFATIREAETTNGTAANAEGHYTLEVNTGKVTIIVEYLGYETITKVIEVTGSNTIVNFKLNEQKLDIGEVIVTNNGEDPAYAKMRKVIAKRKYHADLLKTFETDIYMKGVLRTRSFPKSIMGVKITDSMMSEIGLEEGGKGILYLLEEQTKYWYKAPDQTYTKVISVRESGDPKGLGFATMPPVINVYENNFQILDGLNDRGFISPANSNAFFYYSYKFLGSYFEGERMISKIQVIPKRKYEPLFSGYVYVVEDDWVFKSVHLTLTAQSQMNTLDTLRLEQNYMPLEKDVWVIQSQVLYPTIKIIGMDIAGNFITSYSGQKVNAPIDAGIFSNKIISSYDSLAQSYHTEHWDSIRPIPLAADEIRDYQKKDSMQAVWQKTADSLKKTTSVNLGPGAVLLGGASIRAGKNSWSLSPFIQGVNYNTVEGVNAQLSLNWSHEINEDQRWAIAWQNRYGFANKHYNPLLFLKYQSRDTKWRGRDWLIQMQIGSKVQQLNTDAPINPFINLAYTLIGSKNYMKLFENRVAQLQVRRAWGNGLRAVAGISFEERIPLVNTAFYTFNEKNDPLLTPNHPANLPDFEQHTAALLHASVSYQPGWKYIQYPKYKMPITSNAPIFTARYQKGLKGIINSKSDFDKWSVEVEHTLPLRLLGKVDYRLMTGGFLNKNYVGIPDMKHLFGNQTFLANPYLNSFQLAPYYRFSNTADIYFQGHAEWHLGGLLTNKIPLFRRLNWYLLAGTNTLYINKDDYYAEVYVGLENIGWRYLRFARVDFIAGYESGKDKPSLGIRVGLGDVLWQLLGVNNGREL
jgi:hypothetical protein